MSRIEIIERLKAQATNLENDVPSIILELEIAQMLEDACRAVMAGKLDCYNMIRKALDICDVQERS